MGIKLMRNIKGQTALIMILVCAAALILLAITMNWGKIAQVRTMVTIAADTSAISMASGLASYGQMQKQSYLKATGCTPSSSDDCSRNQYVGSTGTVLSLIELIIAIIILIIAVVFTYGAALIFLAALSVALAAVNLVLQVAVIQPGITAQWNKLQANQPVSQQIYESGVALALQAIVTDQAQVTDYLDWNSNNIYGFTNGQPNDSVSRFAIFYADRLKGINKIVGVPYNTTSNPGPCGRSSSGTSSTSTVTATEAMPNSVIYGWIDRDINGQTGYAHLVEVTAFSGGRNGGSSLFQVCPPYILTSTSGGLATTRYYTLMNRDGLVYVDVKRWDQDHSFITFPNGRNLWAMLGGSTQQSTDLSSCFNQGGFGYGLTGTTSGGITTAMGMAGAASGVVAQDMKSLGDAFMANGDIPGVSKVPGECTSVAEELLAGGVEAKMCAYYIAKGNATDTTSGLQDPDYTVEFYKCPNNVPSAKL